jgi:CRP/FNR family cyclic AMP-dependent transcriptional regulator
MFLHQSGGGLEARTRMVVRNMLETERVEFKLLDSPDAPAKRFVSGDTIIAEGSPPDQMYVVRKGRVAIKVHDVTVEEVGPGGIFGEMALVEHVPRSASVVALEDSEVVPVDERLFIILAQDTPNFALDVMRVMAGRLRRMNQRV